MSTSTMENIGTDLAQSVVAASMSEFGRRLHIVSLHYMGKKVRRPYRTRIGGGAWTDYAFDAVRKPNDRPSVCFVMDGLERVFVGTEDGQRQYEWRAKDTTAATIAGDVIREMTGAPPADHNYYTAPAVWISECGSKADVANGQAKGLIPAVSIDATGKTIYSPEWDTWGTPEFAKQFPEFALECRAFLQRQWRFSEFKLREGDQYADGPQKNPQNINEIHRGAATFVGANSAEHGWIENTTFGAMMPCPYCGKSTSSAHPMCGSCNNIINQAQFDRLKVHSAQANAAHEAPPPQQATVPPRPAMRP